MTRKSGKRYYYRSFRMNGKPVKIYLGYGVIAKEAEEEILNRRYQREALKAENRTWKELFQLSDQQDQLIRQIARNKYDLEWTLINMEYGGLRMNSTNPAIETQTIPNPQPDIMSPSRDTILQQAELGNQHAIPYLLKLLEEEPDLVEAFGDMDKIIRHQLMTALQIKDLRILESYKICQKKLSEELVASSTGTLFEKVLIDRVLSCDQFVQVTQLLLAASFCSDNIDVHQQKVLEDRVNQATRRFDAAYEHWQKHARNLAARKREKFQPGYEQIPEQIQKRIRSSLVGAN